MKIQNFNTIRTKLYTETFTEKKKWTQMLFTDFLYKWEYK